LALDLLGGGRCRLDKHDRDHALQQFAAVIAACERLVTAERGASLMWKMSDRVTVTFVAIVALMVALIVAMAL
jgi:hypothetical protein